MASICRRATNTLRQRAIYRIHPAIGVARVGNSDEFFLGPEIPGLGAAGKAGGLGEKVPTPLDSTGKFKDAAGKIRRQAARFYLWKYIWNTARKQYVPIGEINLDSPNIKTIKWTVELANRKASFFAFQGTNGDTSPYSPGLAFKKEVRNAAVVGAGPRAKLEIAPGPQTIEGKSASGKEFKKTTPGVPVSYLGELKTDDKGRLVVLGGKGVSKPNVMPGAIGHYANNDGWFDDTSDGPIRVEIEFKPGGKLPKVPSDDVVDAWVVVGPPDFAPAMENLVTLWDTLCSVTIQHITIAPEDGLFDDYAPNKGLKRLKQMKADFSAPAGFSGYKVSFRREVYPIIQRVLNYSWTHKGARSAHKTFPWPGLASLAAADKGVKDMFFGWIRKSLNISRPADPALLANPYMPKLLGDEAEEDLGRGVAAGNAREFLMLTDLQYATLKQWWNRKFEADGWPADNKPSSLPAPAHDVTPEGLDRAAAEACVGGAFYPGIEVSWLIRNPQVYGEFWGPFRIDPWQRDATGKIKLDGGGQPEAKEIAYGTEKIRMQAGFFNQQMALPWQADFLACGIETHAPYGEIGWWPAQRPDFVLHRTGAVLSQEDWARGVADMRQMVDKWMTRGFVEKDGADYVEKEF